MANRKKDGRTNNTKERLVLKAIRLFWLQGYTEVSIDQIAKSAKAQKGSVYYFFPSKLDLLKACITLMNQQILKKLEEFENNAETPRQAVILYYKWLIEKQVNAKKRYGFIPGFLNMSVGVVTMGQDEKLSDNVEKYYRRHNEILENLINGPGNKKSLKRVDTNTINYLFSGAVWQARITNSTAPLSHAINAIEALLGAKG